MGKFDVNGGYFAPEGYFRINEGGSHEENPNGGVQIGKDQNGTPNVLEEDESVFNDFVYSDNIVADAEVLKQFNIPLKYAGKLYSEIADAFVDEAEERPNDPVSNNGLNAMLSRVADAQEFQKERDMQNQLEEEMSQLSPEELQQLEMMLSQQGEGQQGMSPEEAAMQEQAMMQGQPSPEEQMMAQQQVQQEAAGQPSPEEQAMMTEQQGMPMMAYGGTLLRSFATGGPKGPVKSKSYPVDWNNNPFLSEEDRRIRQLAPFGGPYPKPEIWMPEGNAEEDPSLLTTIGDAIRYTVGLPERKPEPQRNYDYLKYENVKDLGCGGLLNKYDKGGKVIGVPLSGGPGGFFRAIRGVRNSTAGYARQGVKSVKGGREAAKSMKAERNLAKMREARKTDFVRKAVDTGRTGETAGPAVFGNYVFTDNVNNPFYTFAGGADNTANIERILQSSVDDKLAFISGYSKQLSDYAKKNPENISKIITDISSGNVKNVGSYLKDIKKGTGSTKKNFVEIDRATSGEKPLLISSDVTSPSINQGSVFPQLEYTNNIEPIDFTNLTRSNGRRRIPLWPFIAGAVGSVPALSGNGNPSEPEAVPVAAAPAEDVIRYTPTEITFSDAFADARDRGLSGFWFGNTYHTTDLSTDPNFTPGAVRTAEGVQRDVFSPTGTLLRDSTAVGLNMGHQMGSYARPNDPNMEANRAAGMPYYNGTVGFSGNPRAYGGYLNTFETGGTVPLSWWSNIARWFGKAASSTAKGAKKVAKAIGEEAKAATEASNTTAAPVENTAKTSAKGAKRMSKRDRIVEDAMNKAYGTVDGTPPTTPGPVKRPIIGDNGVFKGHSPGHEALKSMFVPGHNTYRSVMMSRAKGRTIPGTFVRALPNVAGDVAVGVWDWNLANMVAPLDEGFGFAKDQVKYRSGYKPLGSKNGGDFGTYKSRAMGGPINTYLDGGDLIRILRKYEFGQPLNRDEQEILDQYNAQKAQQERAVARAKAAEQTRRNQIASAYNGNAVYTYDNGNIQANVPTILSGEEPYLGTNVPGHLYRASEGEGSAVSTPAYTTSSTSGNTRRVVNGTPGQVPMLPVDKGRRWYTYRPGDKIDWNAGVSGVDQTRIYDTPATEDNNLEPGYRVRPDRPRNASESNASGATSVTRSTRTPLGYLVQPVNTPNSVIEHDSWLEENIPNRVESELDQSRRRLEERWARNPVSGNAGITGTTANGNTGTGSGNGDALGVNWARYPWLTAATTMYNAFMPADKYRMRSYNPVLTQGQMDLVDPTYIPIDERFAQNNYMANNAHTVWGLMNSGAGHTTSQNILANDYNAGKTIGDILTSVQLANAKNRNDVITQRNTNGKMLGDFNYGINSHNVGILNDAELRNIQNSILQQRLNYAAQEDKFNAIGKGLGTIEDSIMKDARERDIFNMINSNKALNYGYSDRRGTSGYKRPDGTYAKYGGTLLRKCKK